MRARARACMRVYVCILLILICKAHFRFYAVNNITLYSPDGVSLCGRANENWYEPVFVLNVLHVHTHKHTLSLSLSLSLSLTHTHTEGHEHS